MIACKYNKALHLTAIPLRSIAAGELGRYVKIHYSNLNFMYYGV
jgi:hypothetical protein